MNNENNNGFLNIGEDNSNNVTPVRDNILRPPTVKEEEPVFVSPTPEVEHNSSPFGLAPPVNNAAMSDPNNNFSPIGLSEGQTLSSIANEHRAARVEGPVDENHDGVADKVKEEEPTEEEIEKSLEKKYVNKNRPQHVKKRKGISSVLVFLFFGLAIAGGVWYVYTYNPFGDNIEGEPTKSNNQIEIFKGVGDSITGIYKNDNGTIAICNAGTYGYVSINPDEGTPVEIYGTIKDDKFEYHSGGVDYVINIDDEEIELETTDTSLIGGIFKVVDKLDIDDCYKEYNDEVLSDNKVSGIYTSDNGQVLINVIDDDNIMVMLYNEDTKLFNNVTLGETEIIDDIKNLNIKESDKIIFNTQGLEILSEDESIKGSYKKLEKVTTKDMITFYGEYNKVY